MTVHCHSLFETDGAVNAEATRPRILLVGNFLSTHGRNRGVCEDLASRLSEAGYVVMRTSNKVSRVMRLADMVFCVLRRRNQFQIAHVDVYSGPAFLWAEAVCFTLRRMGKPYVLTLHGGALPSFAARWPARVRQLLHSAMAVTTPSRYLLEQMAPYGPRLQCLPNGMDVSRYSFRLRGIVLPRLVWVRAFSHIYHPELAPRVVARLQEDFPSCRLVMLGRDSGDGSLQRTRQESERLGVANRVIFRGGVGPDTVASELADADIFLNTTNIDNTPLSIMEALASGLCVISTNVGGLPYLLDHERTALLVPPGDADAMAAAVRRLLSDARLAARLSQTGRECVEPFDWHQVLPQWHALLTDVVQRAETRN